MILELIQATARAAADTAIARPAPDPATHSPEMWAAIGTSAGTFVVAAWTAIAAHKKGSRRDTSSNKQLVEIKDAVGELKTEVAAVKSHVIGPDGQNGLRGDVRELKTDVKGLLERERERDRERDRLHGGYTR
jgi:hypothetical protein